MIPPPLRVPVRHRAGFQAIAGMAEDQFKSVVSVLVAEPTLLNIRELVDRVEAVSGDDSGQQVLEPILSLAGSIHHNQWDRKATADAIATSMYADDEAAAEALSARLDYLLGIQSIQLTAKAQLLGSDVASAVHSVRVITDLRPVFEDDDEVKAGPVGMMIVNTLRLEYLDGEGSKSLYTVLSDDMLSLLQRDLARAEHKAVALRRLVERSDLPLHEPFDFENP